MVIWCWQKNIADSEVAWDPQTEGSPTFSNNQDPKDQK